MIENSKDSPAFLDDSNKITNIIVPGVGHALLFMAIFLCVTGIVSIIGSVVIMLVRIKEGTDLLNAAAIGTETNWVVVAANTSAAAVVMIVGRAWSGQPWFKTVPLGRFTPALAVAIALLSIGFSVLLSEADNLLRYVLPMPDWLMSLMVQTTTLGIDSFVLLVVVAPLTEEAIFRGLFLNGFLSRYSRRSSILLSAFLFSLIHLNPYQLFGAFVLGIVLGWLRVWTGSLWPCILLHAASNGLVILCMALPFEIPGYNVMGARHFQPLWFDLLGIAFVFSGGFLAKKIVAKEYQSEVEGRSALSLTDRLQ